MIRMLSYAAFATGMALILLMTRAVAAEDGLTLLVMGLIAVAYAVGGLELWRFQRATEALQQALNALKRAVDADDSAPNLEAWLGSVPDSLRFAVKQRIVGQGQGLPAPLLTPYLVGLLVMLGLLGTFIGMVATLSGAVQALEGSSELTAIRQGLAAPIQGLGMAFGTSVAGVAASAMLGLIATLSRRERLAVSRELDGHRDGYFRDHSLSHQRTQTYSALQQQAQALPEVVTRLASLSDRLEQMGTQFSQWSERSGEQLLSQQREFESAIREDFHAFTASLSQALKDSLADTGQQTANTLQPFVSQLLVQAQAQLADEAEARRQEVVRLHDTLRAEQEADREARQSLQAEWQSRVMSQAETFVDALGEQLTGLQTLERERFEHSASQLSELQTAFAHQRDAMQTLEQERLAASIDQVDQLQAALTEQRDAVASAVSQSVALLQSAVDESVRTSEQLMTAMQTQADAARERDQKLVEERGALLAEQSVLVEALTAQVAQQQQTVRDMTDTLSQHLEQQARLTSEQLEQLMTESASQLGSVTHTLTGQLTTTLEQHGVHVDQLTQQVSAQLDALLTRNADTLEHVSSTLGTQLEQSGEGVTEAARALTELSQGFADSVAAFGASSETMSTSLAAIADTLASSGARSDEQMGYYVDQAREIIDHNLITQQTILERLETVTSSLQASADKS